MLTLKSLATKLCQSLSLSPTKALRKEMFRGVELRTSTTVAYCLRTILYRDGYWDLNVWLPSHMSSHNLICIPSRNVKVPMLRNWSFTFIRLIQKCKSHVSSQPDPMSYSLGTYLLLTLAKSHPHCTTEITIYEVGIYFVYPNFVYPNHLVLLVGTKHYKKNVD
jgi:hypothetical protein